MAVANSRTVSSPTGAVSCGKWPIVPLRSMDTSPSSAESWPRISENKVDLPAPFGPTSPMRSPRLTCRDASSKSTCAPKALVIPEIVIISNCQAYYRLEGGTRWKSGRMARSRHEEHEMEWTRYRNASVYRLNHHGEFSFTNVSGNA